MIARAFRRWKSARRVARARADIARRLAAAPGRPHDLPHPLLVSVTSYPARFGTLALTLGGLLTQSLRPDAVLLWVAPGQAASLPPEVTALTSRGLDIRETADLRSYTKLIPALRAHPEAAIVTADDDVHYGGDWLAPLVAAGPPVACHRAHRITLGPDGRPHPYGDWAHNIPAPDRGRLVFPTGVSGVLYRPGSLPPETLRSDLFLELCPGADDVWFYWMHRLAGGTAAKIGGKARIVEWPATQETALRTVNHATGNDAAIAALTARYGFPG